MFLKVSFKHKITNDTVLKISVLFVKMLNLPPSQLAVAFGKLAGKLKQTVLF